MVDFDIGGVELTGWINGMLKQYVYSKGISNNMADTSLTSSVDFFYRLLYNVFYRS